MSVITISSNDVVVLSYSNIMDKSFYLSCKINSKFMSKI